VGVLREVGEEESWAPTGCTGWAVRDLTYHCLVDAQRGVVALHSPASQSPERDAVTYWQDWAPDETGAAQGRRHTRVGASMFLVWDQLRELYVDTASAVVHAASTTPPTAAVRTQGHVLRADDLLRTLCVETTIHHLDLVTHLSAPGPTRTGLAEVRRTLDALLSQALVPTKGKVGWTGADAGVTRADAGMTGTNSAPAGTNAARTRAGAARTGTDAARTGAGAARTGAGAARTGAGAGMTDERYALVATGRAEPTEDEARALGPALPLLPLFS
jgi:hypothetical protein